jgi:hypothetical protein
VIVALQLDAGAARLLRDLLTSPPKARRSPGKGATAGARRSPVQRVWALVGDANATVTPVHPLAGDPLLSTYFTVNVPDVEDAARLAAAVLDVPGVEAAYVKPSDEPPPA